MVRRRALAFAGPGMFINTEGFSASLTKAGGGAFSINAIELAHFHATLR